MSETKAAPRIQWIDSLRGIAIILMVIFHFCYDLRYFGYVDWNVPNGPNWWPFRYVILTLFIFTMGMSLTLTHAHGFQWKKYFVRLGQMALAALAITLMSVVMFPQSWIYFGILHFLLLASLGSCLLVRAPLLAMGAGTVVLMLYWSGAVSNQWPFELVAGLPEYTEDYVPVFPWLGVSLLGVAFGGLFPLERLQPVFGWLPDSISWLGRHALVVYLVHQPFLFGGFFLLSKIV